MCQVMCKFLYMLTHFVFKTALESFVILKLQMKIGLRNYNLLEGTGIQSGKAIIWIMFCQLKL